jgi:hypothetical protein
MRKHTFSLSRPIERKSDVALTVLSKGTGNDRSLVFKQFFRDSVTRDAQQATLVINCCEWKDRGQSPPGLPNVYAQLEKHTTSRRHVRGTSASCPTD